MPGVNILANGQFTTYGTLNFFVSGPILKLFLSAETLDQKGHVTKYSPLPTVSGCPFPALTFWHKIWCVIHFPKAEWILRTSIIRWSGGQHGDIWRPRHTHQKKKKNMKLGKKRKNKSSFCLLLHFSWKHQPHHFEVGFFIVSLLWKGRICHFYCEQNAAATVWHGQPRMLLC